MKKQAWIEKTKSNMQDREIKSKIWNLRFAQRSVFVICLVVLVILTAIQVNIIVLIIISQGLNSTISRKKPYKF